MIFYCKHHRETIIGGKVVNYCLKQDCWALKMFKNIGQMKKFIKKNCLWKNKEKTICQ